MSETISCEERINDELQDRLEEFENNELNQDDFGIEILGVSKREVYRVEFSWGGPQDYFDIEVSDGDIVDIEYHFLDWFDGAKRTLEGHDFHKAKRWFERNVYLGDS